MDFGGQERVNKTDLMLGAHCATNLYRKPTANGQTVFFQLLKSGYFARCVTMMQKA